MTPQSESRTRIRVAIMGAGPAGLGAAVALHQRAGIADIRVFDRVPSLDLPGREGHGLILMRNGVQALCDLGLRSALDEATRLRQTILVDARGHTRRTESLEGNVCIRRQRIVDALRHELLPGRLQLGFGSEGIELVRGPEGPRVCSVTMSGGLRLHEGDFDLLVDATGYRSALCHALDPRLRRPSSRVKEIVSSSSIPSLARRLGQSFYKTTFPGRGLAFGLVAPTAEHVIGFLQFDSALYEPPARGWTAEELRAFIRRLVPDVPPLVDEYLRRARLDTAHVWHPVDADLPRRWHAHNAVAIGDAAHPVLPFTSQGVSAALEDGLALADAIAQLDGDVASLPSALGRFARRRRSEVEPFINEGRRILRSFVDSSETPMMPYVERRAA